MTPRKQNGWAPCPAGEWQKLSTQLNFRRRLAIGLRIAAGLLVALALAGGTWIGATALKSRLNEQNVPCHTETPASSSESGGCGSSLEKK